MRVKTFVCNLRSGSDAWSVSPGRAYITHLLAVIRIDAQMHFTYCERNRCSRVWHPN